MEIRNKTEITVGLGYSATHSDESLDVHRLMGTGYTVAGGTSTGKVIVFAIHERIQYYTHVVYYGLCITLYRVTHRNLTSLK